MDDARTIGPCDGEITLRPQRDQRRVARLAHRSRFGKAAGQDQKIAGRMTITASSTGGSIPAIEVTES